MQNIISYQRLRFYRGDVDREYKTGIEISDEQCRRYSFILQK